MQNRLQPWPTEPRRALLLAMLSLLPLGVYGQDSETRYEPGIELPPGQGRELLLAACTRCHDLKGLPAYRQYWNRDRWRSMVDTMVDNGAPLDESGKQLVTAYLARFFGTGSGETE